MVWGEWCRRWPARELHVITARVPGDRDYDLSVEFPVTRVAYPDIPKIRMPWLWLRLAVETLLFCSRRKPDLIHFQHVFENAWLGPILHRVWGIPYRAHVVGEELAFARRYRWLHKLVLFVLRGAEGVTCNSSYTLAKLREFGFEGGCLVAHPGVAVERFSQAEGEKRAVHDLPKGRLLLTVGRLMERKGHDQVIQALPRWLSEYPDLHYVVAGTGPYEQHLKNLVGRLGLESHVHFLGRVDDSDLPGLYRSCEIFVHPNRETANGDVEGFGIVMLEAAASGLPVVAGRSGGAIDSVEHGVSGYLINPLDQDELGSVIGDLLRDRALALRLGERGRVFASGFDWDITAARVWHWSRPARAGTREAAAQQEAPAKF